MIFKATGICKFFHENKGYGFIALDGNRDAFVHGSLANADKLVRYAQVTCVVTEGSKGLQVVELVEITAPERPEGAGWLEAKVKHFNTGGGFGFVVLDHSGENAFIHAAVLKDALGIATLAAWLPVLVQIERGDKGLRVTDIRTV